MLTYISASSAEEEGIITNLHLLQDRRVRTETANLFVNELHPGPQSTPHGPYHTILRWVSRYFIHWRLPVVLLWSYSIAGMLKKEERCPGWCGTVIVEAGGRINEGLADLYGVLFASACAYGIFEHLFAECYAVAAR